MQRANAGLDDERWVSARGANIISILNFSLYLTVPISGEIYMKERCD